jgi:hypothetical protein
MTKINPEIRPLLDRSCELWPRLNLHLQLPSTMRLLYILLTLATLVVSGCVRARVTTEVKSDGSWTRRVALTGPEKKEGQMAPTIDDAFVLPSGEIWKSRQEKKNEELTSIWERTASAGSVIDGDISIKEDEQGKLKLVNSATVTRSGRRIEYRETLRWRGAPPKNLGIRSEDLNEIKIALPKALATDSNARAVGERTIALAVPLMFGPGDPLLAIGLMHPDLAERRATQRIGGLLVKALEEQFGEKIPAAERRDVANQLIQKVFLSTRPSQPDPASGPPGKSSGGLTPLMFVLKLPGKIVSSNGETDQFTGEIYWALFPEAAALKEVVLTAVCEVP